LAAIGALVMAFASNFWWLVVGRIFQGLALGIGLSTATAAVREWMDEGMRQSAGSIALIATGIGAALGALYSGVLAQYAPHPTMLPYLAQFAVLGCVAAAVATVPSCPHLASAAHHGLPTIPRTIRRPFYVASIQAFVGWATISIFVSLLPSFLARSLGLQNLLVGTSIVVLIQIGMVTASFIGRNLRNRTAILTAMLALGGGLWLLLLAVPQHQYAVIVLATLAVGVGNGLSYLAGLNIVNAIAPPEHRAELLAAFLVATNLGFTLPALGVGVAANFVGLYLSIAGGAVFLGIVAVVSMIVATERNIAAPT
jgi:MFS family permease